MKKKLLLGVVSLIAAVSFAQSVNKDYQDGKVIFQIKEDVVRYMPSDDDGLVNFREVTFLKNLADKYKFVSVTQKFPDCDYLPLQKTFEVNFANLTAADDLVHDLQAVSDVIKYAQKKVLHHTCFTPNDTYYGSYQWYLPKINASAAWDISKGKSSVVVAVVDNAMYSAHPDLSPRLSTLSYDIADHDKNINPPVMNTNWDHGSHTSGLVGAATDNNAGIASIGCGITVMAIKATYDTSSNITGISQSMEGILYAVDHGAKVVNCSFSGPATGTISYEQTVIDYAYNKGVVVVAAAGNNGNSTLQYPAACTNVVAVASTGTSDVISSFSNYGAWITLCAPGEGILSAVSNHGGTTFGVTAYDYLDGTSMSAPIVSGLIGLMLSANPNLTPAQIISCLKSSCDNIDAANSGKIGKMGAGRINAQKAMQCASTTLTPPIVNFMASRTVINTGNSIAFADLSTNTPTTYTWSFTGGTPATSSVQNPPAVQYAAAGCYAVTLTAANASGSNSTTKTCYINVTSGTIVNTCDSALNIKPTDTLTYYTLGTKIGYLSGTNDHFAKSFAEYYATPPTSGYNITAVKVYFGKIQANAANTSIDFNIWSDASGKPGTVLATKSIPTATLATALGGKAGIIMTYFDNPVKVTGPYYAGIQIVASGNPCDTIAVITSKIGEAAVNTAWQSLGLGWFSYQTAFTVKMANYISPRFCKQSITGIDEEMDADAINVYPNPSAGEINVQLPQGYNKEIQISVYNLIGELITSATKTDIQSGLIKFNLSSQNQGVYLVESRTADGLSVKKVVLTK